MGDPVPFANFPKARRVRIRRNSFVHHHGRPLKERTVGQVTVARNPADIGRTPEHIPGLGSKNLRKRIGRVHHVPSGAVQHAFGFAGGTRRIKNKQGILGIHPTRFGPGQGGLPQVFPAQPFRGSVRGSALLGRQSALDQNGGHRVLLPLVKQGQRLNDHGTTRQSLGPTTDLFRANHPSRAGIGDTIRQTAGRKAPKNNGMHRPQAGAGQDGP